MNIKRKQRRLPPHPRERTKQLELWTDPDALTYEQAQEGFRRLLEYILALPESPCKNGTSWR